MERFRGIPKQDLKFCYSIKPGLSGIMSILLRNEEDLLRARRTTVPITEM